MGLFDRKIKDGVHADAKIVDMAPTAKAARQPGKRNVDFHFRLRVRTPQGAEQELDHTCTVPWDRTPAVGQMLPVIVSASDPTRVKIDWDAVPSTVGRFRAAADAARRGDSAGAAQALGYQLREQPPQDQGNRD